MTLLRQNSGQSIIELLLLLPLLLGFISILVRVNTAIQSSIVNQQYTRAQALFLAHNSSVYPRLEQRQNGVMRNQLVLGMAEQQFNGENAEDLPIAPTVMIARNGKGGPDGGSQTEAQKRANVRIRTTVSLCTQSTVIRDGDQWVMLDSSSLKPNFSSRQFAYCAPYDDMEPSQ